MLSERLVSLKTFLKPAQNQSLSSKICSGSSHEIGRSLPIIFQRNWPRKFPRNFPEIGRFFREFVPGNPAKFDFFSATYQKPCFQIRKTAYRSELCTSSKYYIRTFGARGTKISIFLPFCSKRSKQAVCT